MGKKHQEEGGGGESVGLWYVSFADMITLLLAFFVMLATFSSYSKESLCKFEGVWSYLANYSVFDKVWGNDSMYKHVENVVDWTQEGAEKSPADMDPKVMKRPRDPLDLSSELSGAYHDKRIVRLPSDSLFVGPSPLLKPEGRRRLDLVAQFVNRLPCQVVITECLPADASAEAYEATLNRTWNAALHIIDKGKQHPAGFSISRARGADACPEGRPTIEISLLARRPGQ